MNNQLPEGTVYQATMSEVRISKLELIKILNSNKAKHDQVYEDAVKGYWAKAEETLTQALEKVKVKERAPNDIIRFDFPDNHTEDYNTAIQQLMLSIDGVVVLSNAEFRQYVMNQWTWRRDFLSKSSLYTAISGASL